MDQGVTKNISQGGIFIETPMACQKGEMVEFDLIMPKRSEKVSIRGIVRWCQRADPQGMGIEIFKMSVDSKRRLSQCLREISPDRNDSESP